MSVASMASRRIFVAPPSPRFSFRSRTHLSIPCTWLLSMYPEEPSLDLYLAYCLLSVVRVGMSSPSPFARSTSSADMPLCSLPASA